MDQPVLASMWWVTARAAAERVVRTAQRIPQVPGLGPDDLQRSRPGPGIQSEIKLGLPGSDPLRRDQLQRCHFVIAVGRAEMLNLTRPPP